MERKLDCTRHSCTATGRGHVVEGVRPEWGGIGKWGYALPDMLGSLDAPESIAAGSVRESMTQDAIMIASNRRGRA